MTSETESASTALRQALLRDFKTFYNQTRPDLDQLADLYTEDVEFRDPVHTLHGRLALRRYLSGVYANCRSVAFHYTDEDVTGNGASIAWNMTLSHPRLDGGREIQVRGITMIRFSDRIYYQEDFYDLGNMLYQHVPVLGRIIRHIKGRLAG
ncbi:MAG: nuclear transport factor 2 family protein [Pseudohongiellaceae bacterium]